MSLTPAQSYHSEDSPSKSLPENISQSLPQSPLDSSPDEPSESPPDSPRFIVTSLDLSRSSIFDDDDSVDLQQQDEEAVRKEYHDNNDCDALRSFNQSYYDEEEEQEQEENEDEDEHAFIKFENNSLSDNFYQNIESGYPECDEGIPFIGYSDDTLSNSFSEHVEYEHCEDYDDVFSETNGSFSIQDYNSMPNPYDHYDLDSQPDSF